MDSLLPIKWLREREIKSLLDIGSGAGFPAIPLKICLPWLKITMLEPNKKKFSFLRYISTIMGLKGLQILNKRFQDIAWHHKDQEIEMVTSRAVMPIEDLIMGLRGFVRPIKIIAFGGMDTCTLISHDHGLDHLGVRLLDSMRYSLPNKPSKRCILLLYMEPLPQVGTGQGTQDI